MDVTSWKKRQRKDVFTSLNIEFRLIIAIFTCYRLARLISRDDGPLFLFKRARYWAKDRAWNKAEEAREIFNGVIDDRYYSWQQSLAEGLECPYCLGVWLSIPLFLFVIYPMELTDLFMLLMTISGVQAWLWGMANR